MYSSEDSIDVNEEGKFIKETVYASKWGPSTGLDVAKEKEKEKDREERPQSKNSSFSEPDANDFSEEYVGNVKVKTPEEVKEEKKEEIKEIALEQPEKKVSDKKIIQEKEPEVILLEKTEPEEAEKKKEIKAQEEIKESKNIRGKPS